MENTFEVVSGKMILSDPCYELGTWCQGVVENVKNGTWVGIVEQSDEGNWGTRNSILISLNKEEFIKNPKLENELLDLTSKVELLDFDGGVDSGQFGHFDFQHYRNDLATNGYPKAFDDSFSTEDGDEWYRVCCYVTLENKDCFGAVPFGVVSSSGYGDGSYDTYGIKNDDGQFVGFMTIFIGNQEEEEEEESDYDVDPDLEAQDWDVFGDKKI